MGEPINYVTALVLYERLVDEFNPPPSDPRKDTSLPNVRLPGGHSWSYVKELGEGGEGTAHLWAHVDSNQKIVEHVVIRNTTVNRYQLVDGEWLELYIQQQLAPHGSTDACTVPILAAEQIPGFEIKPSNILMGSPGSLGKDEDYIAYPPAYLGDFGLAYFTSGNDAWRMKLDGGTRGYFPPELKSGPMPLNIQRRPPGSEANVWQVGETMLVAMMGGIHPQDGPQGRVYRTRTHWLRLIENGQWSNYSRDLIELAESCVKYDMDLRPSPMDILVRVLGCMHMHNDGMDRWGTLSWVMEESRKIDGPVPDEDTGYEDAGYEADAGANTAAGAKRKASGPPTMPPDTKRSKAETALRRRLATVATDIKGHRPRLHADDKGFRLRQTLKLIYENEYSISDPETFFDAADSGPIKFLELDPTANDNTKKIKPREFDGVVYIDDDDDDYFEAKSLPDPVTPAQRRKAAVARDTDDYIEIESTPPVEAKVVPKAAGTSANPILVTPTPVKPKKGLRDGAHS
ncbi:hypothetical protein KCU98_g1393, partial [Aureobasidium melanogenum]